MSLNRRAQLLCKTVKSHASLLRIGTHELSNGASVLDFGVQVRGGLEAGLHLARICMADRVRVSIMPADRDIYNAPLLQVYTDAPVEACMASQYAGWPVKHESFFAMGSGPMRARRGKEHVLKSLGVEETEAVAVGVLECDALPDETVIESMAVECRVEPSEMIVCVAPTRSIAGIVQVVARSIETAMHKLFELGFDLNCVVSGHGTAPIPPAAIDFVQGIGRTNDAILYGGHVTLWLETEDAAIESIGAKIPSRASRDYGQPFAAIFKSYGYDFYKVDPGLFSPAVITLINLKTGRSWRYGSMRPDVLELSFAELVA